ncbi:hypothetical protein HDU97_003648 [Phlyctochytrium planicorne]|nr:hypothetical protein HDU97_003648 [Phlyctochytrium planicorne]
MNASQSYGDVGARGSRGVEPTPLRQISMKRSQSVNARSGSNMENDLMKDLGTSTDAPKSWSKRRLSQPLVLAYNQPTGEFVPADEISESEEPKNQSSRMDRVRERRTKRTTKHIGQFLKVNVQLSTGLGFDVTVDKSHTIEYLAHQIEAEYAFRNVLASLGQSEREDFDPQQKTFEPLEIGQLFDSGMLALKFSDTIGDVLSFNDTVLVINTYGANSRGKDGSPAPLDVDLETDPVRVNDKAQSSHGSVTSMGDFPEDTPARARQISVTTTGTTQTLDDRLQMLLHSKLGLVYFHQFCLEEYCVENLLFWLMVEVLQNCDASIRGTFAKFIYLVYIAHSSPLSINVSPEIRNDIKEAFSSGSPSSFSDVGVFDEAQENVYAVLKDKKRYIESKINGTYADAFPSTAQTIFDLVSILEDPSSESSAEAIARIGDGKRLAVNSNEFRELFLSLCSNEFFATQPDLFYHYFDAVSRMSWAQKQKKMQKEKKLSKFFGERPSSEQLQRQTNNQRRISLTMLKENIKDDGDELDAILSNSSLDGNGDPTARRKKMEKLETFFGDKIPKKQKVEQSLVTANDELNLIFSTENSDDEAPDGIEAICEDISATNELPPEQRRILNKRNKKISTLLGETLDEKTISKVLDTANMSKAVLPMVPNDQTVLSPTPQLQEEEGDDSFEDSSDPNGQGSNNVSNKKKRLDKLSSMLGERIKVNDVSDSQAAVAVQNTPHQIGRVLPTPRVLTPDERKQVQRRANKIERLMGVIPPTEALISTISESEAQAKLSSEAAKKLQKGIASISFFIQNTSDVVELLETLSVVSAEFPNLEPRRLSMVSDEGEPVESKESRQRRINKLRKFFGNDINVIALIENQLLSDLEQNLEEVVDQGDKQVLMENMKSLRVMMNRRSNEFQIDLKKSLDRPSDNVYITASSPESSNQSENYTPRSTKPLVRSPTMPEVKEAPAVLDDTTRRQSVVRKEVWES